MIKAKVFQDTDNHGRTIYRIFVRDTASSGPILEKTERHTFERAVRTAQRLVEIHRRKARDAHLDAMATTHQRAWIRGLDSTTTSE